MTAEISGDDFAWWRESVLDSVLEVPRWVQFDLETLVIDTLNHSPLVQSVSEQTSVALEAIVQQDAAFDSSVLFDSGAGRSNDPVGNTLTTGGPPRLIDDSLNGRAGVRRTTRNGGTLELSQEVGLLTSNSTFFTPTNQANSRLSVSLAQPLMDRSGRAYNERLLMQARIDGRVAWQDMRGDVEQRIADVMIAYWRLYELRCHLLQQIDLQRRGEHIESLVMARRSFDAGRIELAKTRQRVARRADQRLELDGEVKKQQTRIASLVGAEELLGGSGELEFIPREQPGFPDFRIDLRDAVQQGIENRPEVRAATSRLQAAGLAIRVTRTELEPKLTAVVDAYLAGLNGNFAALNSLQSQFNSGWPGVAAGIQYERPYRRRAARSRYRQAQSRFRQRSAELQESIQTTQAQIESSLVSLNTAIAARATRKRVLQTSIDEEEILTRRWELMASDGSPLGIVLENLLDAQQRRTDAERQWTSAQTDYVIALVNLQRAMGTLLRRTGIQSVQSHGNQVDFDYHGDEPDLPNVPQSSGDHVTGFQNPITSDAPEFNLGNEPSAEQPLIEIPLEDGAIDDGPIDEGIIEDEN